MSQKFKLLATVAGIMAGKTAAEEPTAVVIAPAPTGAAPTPTPAPLVVPTPSASSDAPNPTEEDDDGEEVDVVTAAAARQACLDSHAAGQEAERQRTAAVFGSPAAKGRFEMAAFMLAHNPQASAESIIGHLQNAPAAQVEAARASLTVPLSQTPIVPVVPVQSTEASGENEGLKILADIQKSSPIASYAAPYANDKGQAVLPTGN